MLILSLTSVFKDNFPLVLLKLFPKIKPCRSDLPNSIIVVLSLPPETETLVPLDTPSLSTPARQS
jgi:hypothetical protein